jgi:DNA polymerase III sliding clamp (beta) subunit (PCNA family)
MKHIATVPAALIRAAMAMQATNDVRFYLNGVYIDSESIVGTDGHVLFVTQYESDKRPESPMVISIKGNIPYRAYNLQLFYDEDAKIGVAKCFEPTPKSVKRRDESGEWVEVEPTPLPIMDSKGHQQMLFFHIIDKEGRFPRFKSVIPTGDLIPTDVCVINCDLMARVAKSVKALGQKSGMVKASMRGASSAIVMEPALCQYEYAKFIVMPCRI